MSQVEKINLSIPAWCMASPPWYQGDPHWSEIEPFKRIVENETPRRRPSLSADSALELAAAVESTGYRVEDVRLVRLLMEGRVRCDGNARSLLDSIVVTGGLVNGEVDDEILFALRDRALYSSMGSSEMIGERNAAELVEAIASRNWRIDDINSLWWILSHEHAFFDPAALCRFGGFFSVARGMWLIGMWPHRFVEPARECGDLAYLEEDASSAMAAAERAVDGGLSMAEPCSGIQLIVPQVVINYR